MNAMLRKLMIDAEGRYLNGAELDLMRTYASNMAGRLETAKRLELAEATIVQLAEERCRTEQAELFKEWTRSLGGESIDSHEWVQRELSLTLRYISSALVRDDMDYFRRHYVGWMGELLQTIVPMPLLQSLHGALRSSIEQSMDAADARMLVPYIDELLRALQR